MYHATYKLYITIYNYICVYIPCTITQTYEYVYRVLNLSSKLILSVIIFMPLVFFIKFWENIYNFYLSHQSINCTLPHCSYKFRG